VNAHLCLQPGVVRLLDGGTGTELQKRGIAMSTQAWCGPAALENSAALEQVHRDYIAAGADIVTANTYASSRHLLALDGFGDAFEQINRTAVAAARQARDASGRQDILVAGSLSHRGAIAPGTARPDGSSGLTLDAMYDDFTELALLLRDEGCDLILLEMMYDPVRMPAAFAAAAQSGLPVWAGFSARRGRHGEVLGFDPGHDVGLEQVVSILQDWEVQAAGLMHTPSDLISEGLQIVRAVFDGPLLAYPDSGYFKSPNWAFENVIRPEELRRFAEDWIAQGVQVLGGCCGLGPEHIAALQPLRRPAETVPG
jgi:homocysteine S-methyltransferase